MSLRSLSPRLLVLLVPLIGLLIVAVLVTTRGGSGSDAARIPTSSPSTTSAAAPAAAVLLGDYDTATLTVQRAEFCDLIAPETIESALGGVPLASSAYGNGESTAITPEVTDIAAEFGCRWKRGRTAVRAWVFAPPVTSKDANSLVAAARKTAACSLRRGAPAFGDPSVARTCPVGEGYEASYRGLFGDAWLVCSVTTPGDRAAALDLAGSWCVAVAEAASRPPA